MTTLPALAPLAQAAAPAAVLYLPNALVPQRRELRSLGNLATVLELDPHWSTPYIAILDGAPLLRRDWDWQLQPGQTLAFVDVRALPQGGNSGGGGSDPMRIIAMMALTYFTMGAGSGWLVGQWSLSGVAAGSFGAFALQTTAYLVGSALLNAVLPPQQQSAPGASASTVTASPTYNLNAQGNMARLGAAIPEHFGRLMAYPDLAALPYQEFRGNEQYLYQLLCVGRGSYSIESIRIEDTPISAFDDITYEVIAPGGSVTLFPTAVVTSTEVSGAELNCFSATYSQSGTTVTVTSTNHGLSVGKEVYLDYTSGTAVDGSFTVTSAPTASTFTVTAAGSLTTSGNVAVSPWAGGFILTEAGTTANRIGVDCVMPRGLFVTNAGGGLDTVSLTVQVQARTVDDAGNNVGNWITLGTEVWSAATATPQRYSQHYEVAAARYKVRTRRVDVEQTGSTYGHNVLWGSLRAYLPDARSYGDVTLLAFIMRASNNLSSMAARKVNVIATRNLPVWNGATWSAATATRSPAWPIAYAAKQIGLTDAQIDLGGLLTLDATWAARGDNFDGRFDNFASFMETVARIAQAGRAKPFMQGGILRLVRDQAATLPVQMYSQRNIIQGSFALEYLMPTPETADAIDVNYVDAQVWKPRRVRAAVAGSTAAKPVKMELFGVTDRGQAYREGLYQAACNRYRRRMIRFETEMEGFIPSLGDLIAVQHDMPAWGQGGEVVAFDGVGTNLCLYSEQLGNAYWLHDNTTTISADASAAPDGSVTADKMMEAATAAGHYRYKTISRAAGDYTVSCYLKQGERQWAYIQIGTDTQTKRYTVLIDLATGTFVMDASVGSPVGTSYSIKSVGNGWYRLALTATHTSGTVMIVVGSSNSAAPSIPTYALPQYQGDVSKGVYVWGVQIEATSAATPYIRTTAAAASGYVYSLSESLTWQAGSNHYLGLRRMDGGVDGPYLVTSTGDANKVVFASAPAITPYTGQMRERTHFSFGWGESWRQTARVLNVKPSGLHRVAIEAVAEDPNVHTADQGVTVPSPSTSQLANYNTAPSVDGLMARSLPGNTSRAMLTWQPSQWADYYIVEQSVDGSRWERMGEPRTASFTFTALYGSATRVRVAAVGVARGAWRELLFGSSGDYMWSATATDLMWSATPTNKMWKY